jgi:N-dimethylarginine dimethylaminohydrolase
MVYILSLLKLFRCIMTLKMKKILMCPPDYFRVDYVINPWMKIGSVDQKKAEDQWKNLINEYRKLNLKIEFIKPSKDCPDMVFAADQAITIDRKKILLSRFRYQERAKENMIYADWFKKNKYTIIELPAGLFFEGGGELQRWRDYVLISTGFRTNQQAALAVGKILNKKVISLKLIDKHFYHLDTCLFALNKDTVFYYPPAFSETSRSILQKTIPNLIEFNTDEINNFSANSVVVDSTVIMQTGNNKMAKQLGKLGYRTIKINVGEFVKAGGGIHCLTGDLG